MLPVTRRGNQSEDILQFLPVGIDVRGRRCLVVGGGAIGARKVANLAEAGAEVTVVSPALADVLVAQLESSRVNWIKSTYSPEHLEGAFLVVAATDDQSLNAAIVESATERGMLICDASSAERSQVIFGALHRSESNVTIAVFTDGRDPAEARRTRDQIAGLLDPERRVQDQSGPS